MRRRSLILILGCATVFAAVAQTFKTTVREVREQENGVFNVADVEANGERFSIVVPRGWRSSLNEWDNSLSFYSANDGAPITIRFSTNFLPKTLEITNTLWRSVAPFLKDATALAEFPAYTGYGPGQCADFSFLLQGLGMRTRIVVVPLAQGYVSFVLSCSVENWSSAQQGLSTAVRSFRLADQETQKEPSSLGKRRPREERAQAAASVGLPIPGADAPMPSEETEAPVKRSIFDGKREYVLIGLALALVIILTTSTLARHKREAEIRALSGAYLSDGTEIARFQMPSFFDEPVSAPVRNLDFDNSENESGEDQDDAADAKSPLTEFFAAVPDQLAEMRKILPELGRAFDEDERKQTFLKLHELVCNLKERATCWDLRPVWQLTSALELLLTRLAEKGKEATPSTNRTVASAIDLLGDLCVPGVRPDLIIHPPMAVLAVDDDPLCLRAVVFALQKAEMTPDVAKDGQAAVDLAANKSYDVVFMDIMMPVMDGLKACAALRETPKNKTTPVVFVTARSDFRARTESTLVGGADLMAKPFLMFEITVKALTYAMRKRLDLAESSRRNLAALNALSRAETPTAPAEPVAA